VAAVLAVGAAAGASDRLRFGTQVLNTEFWNPVLLAREAAAVDVLTDGTRQWVSDPVPTTSPPPGRNL